VKIALAVDDLALSGVNRKKINNIKLISLDHAFLLHHPGFYLACPVAGASLQAPTVAGSLAAPDT